MTGGMFEGGSEKRWLVVRQRMLRVSGPMGEGCLRARGVEL